MIQDEDGWLALLESRNNLAHTYSDEQALYVIGKVKSEHIPLFEALKAELEKNWLE